MNTPALPKSALIAIGLTFSSIASVNAQTIVNFTASTTGAEAPQQGSLDVLSNNAGLSSDLNHGDDYNAGALPTHLSDLNMGARWWTWEGVLEHLPSTATLDFDLQGGAQSNEITSVILYNYNEAGLFLDRGFAFVDVYSSSDDGGSWDLVQTDLSFAQASLDVGNSTIAQTVDFSSAIAAGVTDIRFTNIRNFNGANNTLTGIGEIRFVAAVPEPGFVGLLAGSLALGWVMLRRRR